MYDKKCCTIYDWDYSEVPRYGQSNNCYNCKKIYRQQTNINCFTYSLLNKSIVTASFRYFHDIYLLDNHLTV